MSDSRNYYYWQRCCYCYCYCCTVIVMGGSLCLIAFAAAPIPTRRGPLNGSLSLRAGAEGRHAPGSGWRFPSKESCAAFRAHPAPSRTSAVRVGAVIDPLPGLHAPTALADGPGWFHSRAPPDSPCHHLHCLGQARAVAVAVQTVSFTIAISPAILTPVAVFETTIPKGFLKN